MWFSIEISDMAIGQFTNFRELLQYQQGQKEALAARGGDLRLAQMLSRILDPSLPKGFRQMGLRSLSQEMGVDPRGDRAKEIIGTLSGLDPQSMEGIRRGIIETSGQSQPGQISQMTRGILTGQVPPEELLNLASSAMRPPAAAEEQEPPMKLGGPGSDQSSAVSEEPQEPLTRMPFSAQQGTVTLPRYKEGETSPRMREIAPELSGVLGLAEERYRNIDVIKGGYNRIPTDYEGQQKMASDIKGMQDGVINTISLSSQLSKLVGDRAEVLGSLGPGRLRPPGNWAETVVDIGRTISNANLSNIVLQTKDALASLGVFVPEFIKEGGKKLIQEGKNIEETIVGKSISDASTKLVDNFLSQYGEQIGGAAEANARIRSIMIPLAFAMASAKGQTGRHLSDRDVALQMEEIGNSRSPRQFQAALTDMVGRIYEGYSTKVKAQTGGNVPIAHAIDEEAAKSIRGSRVVPEGLMSQLNSIQQGEVAAPGPEQPKGRLSMGEGLKTVLPKTPEATAQEKATVVERRKLPRSGPTIEEEEGSKVRSQQEDRAAVFEARQQNRRRLELAEEANQRANRQEQERRHERIQAAFEAAGRRLSSGGGASVGGGVPSVEGQDASAFRINPYPRRQPPTPVQATPFQPQLPLRR
jgi:hypothetical protein